MTGSEEGTTVASKKLKDAVAQLMEHLEQKAAQSVPKDQALLEALSSGSPPAPRGEGDENALVRSGKMTSREALERVRKVAQLMGQRKGRS